MKTFFEIFNEIIGGIPYGEGGNGMPQLFITLRPLYNLPATVGNMQFLFGDSHKYDGNITIDQLLNQLDLEQRKIIKLTPEAIARFQIQFPETLYLKEK